MSIQREITFAHLSNDEHKITHNYFETSRGKSPCDGLGAVVQNTCYNAMISGKAVIGNATDVYELVGKDEDRHISKRSIVYVDARRVIREETGAKTLPRTRMIHSAKNVGIPFNLKVRTLSCFCTSCCQLPGNQQCENVAYVEPWQAVVQQFVVTSVKEVQETVENTSGKYCFISMYY